jgi:hypothetical protein
MRSRGRDIGRGVYLIDIRSLNVQHLLKAQVLPVTVTHGRRDRPLGQAMA